jgi:hypothetical protein
MRLVTLLLLATTATATQQLYLYGTAGNYDSLINLIETKCQQKLRIQVNENVFNDTVPVVYLPGYKSTDINKANNMLIIGAELDGVNRFSNFATTRHIHQSTTKRFVVIEGASHHSFLNKGAAMSNKLDLIPEISNDKAQESAAIIIQQWLQQEHQDDLLSAERRAKELSDPIVKALELEGSSHTGKDICNSDFPTNPTCNYPMYPNFSLPPGPAKAPSPLPSKDCICGSKWVTSFAMPVIAGATDKNFTVSVADSFHDVSDTHPFHLPHDWNDCTTPEGCNLNLTTLTMNVNGSGTLFPNASSPPLSALELRTKMKSRKIIWEAAGLGKQSGDVDKKNMTLCKEANQMAWDWALENADASVRARFEKSGEPFVMVDDVEAPIGLSGPTWIKKELVYTRNEGKIEIQSWTFVVPESPIKSKYLPTGMHYCKLLSPARCMEWIYTDGLRESIGM